MSKRQETTICFPALPDYVGVVRATLTALLARLEAKPAVVEDLKVAVSEACTNIVRYAYARSGGAMQVRFIAEPRKITVLVSDTGRGFNAKHPPQRPLKDTDIHLGLGLVLMRSMVDSVKIKSQSGRGTIVTLVKKL